MRIRRLLRVLGERSKAGKDFASNDFSRYRQQFCSRYYIPLPEVLGGPVLFQICLYSPMTVFCIFRLTFSELVLSVV